jgi:large subunit ribosomal protein L18
MAKTSERHRLLDRRRRSIRAKITGTADVPRLRVTRTLKHIYVQLIDDTTGRTLAATSSVKLKIPGGTVAAAKAVGAAVGEVAKENSIVAIRFDRGGHRYHGRVKALADAAREAGLQF